MKYDAFNQIKTEKSVCKSNSSVFIFKKLLYYPKSRINVFCILCRLMSEIRISTVGGANQLFGVLQRCFGNLAAAKQAGNLSNAFVVG